MQDLVKKKKKCRTRGKIVLKCRTILHVAIFFIYHLHVYFSIPVRSIFECIGEGCQVVAMSTDAKYIAVITAGTPQVTCMYIIIYYRYTEWKGLWCSSTVWLINTDT